MSEAQAHLNAERRVIEALVGANASETTREAFRRKLRSANWTTRRSIIQVADIRNGKLRDPRMPGGSASVINLSEMPCRRLVAAPRQGAWR